MSTGILRVLRGTIEQAVQGHRCAAGARLGQAHGPHAHDADPSRARVPRSIITGGRRPGEDELSASATVIDSPANVRPDVRHQLPFVDQERCGLVKDKVGRDFGGGPLLRVHVQADLRGCLPAGGGGLPAGLGSLDEYRADDFSRDESSPSAIRGRYSMRLPPRPVDGLSGRGRRARRRRRQHPGERTAPARPPTQRLAWTCERRRSGHTAAGSPRSE